LFTTAAFPPQSNVAHSMKVNGGIARPTNKAPGARHTGRYRNTLSVSGSTVRPLSKGDVVRRTIEHCDNPVGRIVLGPRRVRNGYARIVANANGSGRIELFDARSGAWRDAAEKCTFSELWSAPPNFDRRYLNKM
jgi:hypothetical protein